MASLSEIIRESQIWKSIFRHPAPVDRRNRVVVMLTNFFLHLHPVSIKKQGIALSFTWCMGGVTFFLFLVEVITVWLHMYRVFLTGSYKPPREFNWLVGVILLLLTLLLSFTGYLLPWDQLALWAVTVGTNMMGYTPVFGTQVKFVLLGSKEIGNDTLLRWYVLHVLMLPFVIVIFMAVHFWRVRKDGGVSGPL